MKPFFSDKGEQRNAITLVENDEIISDDIEVAETFNTFFANAAASLNIDIPKELLTYTLSVNDPIDAIIMKFSNHPSIISINRNVDRGRFSFGEIYIADIEDELKGLNETKACMSSSIPPKILKEYSDLCAKPLMSIINKGISSNEFEDSLKLADLAPIHKAEDITNKKNYRNVSLLPVV